MVGKLRFGQAERRKGVKREEKGNHKVHYKKMVWKDLEKDCMVVGW
jgi:hypothetical protein